MKPGELHEAIVRLLDEKLKPFVRDSRPLNLVTCTEIYTTIFDALVEVVTESKAELTNESVNWLAQAYYLGVRVNGNQELDPDIFSKQAKLEDIETEELALLAVMLGGTDFAATIIEEVRSRQ